MSKESRKRSIARAYLMENLKCSKSTAYRKEIEVRNFFTNYDAADFKYCLGLTRLYTDAGYDRRMVKRVDELMIVIGSDAHKDEYDNNLNGMTAKEIVDKFSGMSANTSDNREKRDLVKNDDYTIVPIMNHPDCRQFAPYTTWCITYESDGNYMHYTNDNEGKFYVVLHKDYKTTPKEKGENAPLDLYGLSMIAVSVGSTGQCMTITSRWNHDCGGNDKVMSVEALENLIGMNFSDAFPKRTKEERKALGVMSIDDVIDEGIENIPQNIIESKSENIISVKLKNKYYAINVHTKTYVTNILCPFYNGLSITANEQTGYYSLINEDLQVVTDNLTYIDELDCVDGKYIMVQDDHLMAMFVDWKGNIVNRDTYTMANSFCKEGVATAKTLNSLKMHAINENFERISQDFDSMNYWEDGHCRVFDKDITFYVDSKMNVTSEPLKEGYMIVEGFIHASRITEGARVFQNVRGEITVEKSEKFNIDTCNTENVLYNSQTMEIVARGYKSITSDEGLYVATVTYPDGHKEYFYLDEFKDKFESLAKATA